MVPSTSETPTSPAAHRRCVNIRRAKWRRDNRGDDRGSYMLRIYGSKPQRGQPRFHVLGYTELIRNRGKLFRCAPRLLQLQQLPGQPAALRVFVSPHLEREPHRRREVLEVSDPLAGPVPLGRCSHLAHQRFGAWRTLQDLHRVLDPCPRGTLAIHPWQDFLERVLRRVTAKHDEITLRLTDPGPFALGNVQTPPRQVRRQT